VSNSSSSSFILDGSSYASVFDLAEDMIKFRDWNEKDEEDIKKLRELEIDNNTPISFGSCNYDTYIVKENDYYLISTCNNHPFYNLFDNKYLADRNKSEELYEKYDEDLDSIKEKFDFYKLETDIVGRETDCYSKEHFYCCERSWKVNGYHICPECLKDKDGSMRTYNKIRRENKLNRIIL
jgi:hypothetical protein